MAAEHLGSWSPAVLTAAHASLLALLDAAATPAKITLHSSADTLLSTVPLTQPAGSVDSETGALTLTPDGRDDSAVAGGVASYASIRDGDDTVLRSLPCISGMAPVPGYCVLNNLSIVEGGPVALEDIVIS